MPLSRSYQGGIGRCVRSNTGTRSLEARPIVNRPRAGIKPGPLLHWEEKMTHDKLVEDVAQKAIETIEATSLEMEMSLAETARVCYEVAAELRSRGDGFDSEAHSGKGEDEEDGS